MDFANMNIWCWLIPALVGLISGILGYLIGKASTDDHSDELKVLEDRNARLAADLKNCNDKLAAKDADLPFDAAAALAAFGKKVKHNDLKIVEGIGPKIEKLFHNFDITTWRALSEASVAKCQEVLDSGGDDYKIHDPASWPMQAKMAYEGKWLELVKWQEEHLSGKL